MVEVVAEELWLEEVVLVEGNIAGRIVGGEWDDDMLELSWLLWQSHGEWKT